MSLKLSFVFWSHLTYEVLTLCHKSSFQEQLRTRREYSYLWGSWFSLQLSRKFFNTLSLPSKSPVPASLLITTMLFSFEFIEKIEETVTVAHVSDPSILSPRTG